MLDICDGCGKNEEIEYTYYAENFLTKRNWDAEFLVKKGRVKDDKNSFQFCNQCQEELKKYRAEELIKELSQKNLATSDDFPKYYFAKGNFTSQGYQAVEEAIRKNVIRHISEWKITKLKPLGGGEIYHDWDGDHENKEIILLVHQSAQIEYGEDGFFKEVPKKMYPKPYFSPQQWAEIEKVLSQKQATTENQSPTKPILIILGFIVLIIGIIILITYLPSQRKRTRKINQ